MAQADPITRHLGKTERTLQTLLQRQLEQVRISFPEWVTLTYLSGPSPVPRRQLGTAMAGGKVVDPEHVDGLIASMVARRLVQETPDGLVVTDQGRAIFMPLRERVTEITASLESGIPEDDLAATRRTLTTLHARAEKALAETAEGA